METVDKVIKVFEQFRMAAEANDEFESTGKSVLREKMVKFVALNQPIKFSILGFPMKSPNTRDKVIGTLPDMAEQLTIETFKDFNSKVSEVYPPGIILSVVSDGLVFNDIMEVSESTVMEYQQRNVEMVGNAPINWYNAFDFYGKNVSINSIRTKITEQFGITELELQRRILMDADVNSLYRGMIRFMNLDLAIKDFSSNTQLQKQAKITAKQMMFRNEAYSALIRQEFSDHIRLSMHHSINNGTKYSFQLIRSTGNIFTSAWHCAIAIVDDIVHTMHKQDAIAQGFELVNVNGQPYHFQK